MSYYPGRCPGLTAALRLQRAVGIGFLQHPRDLPMFLSNLRRAGPCTQSLDGSADNPFLSVSEGTGYRSLAHIAAESRYLVSGIVALQGGG